MVYREALERLKHAVIHGVNLPISMAIAQESFSTLNDALTALEQFEKNEAKPPAPNPKAPPGKLPITPKGAVPNMPKVPKPPRKKKKKKGKK